MISPSAAAHARLPAAPRWRGRAAGVMPIRSGLRWAFLFFIASMLVETAKLPGMPATLTISKLFGYLFFLCAIVQSRLAFRRPPAAVIWFMIYVAAVALLARFQPSSAATSYVLQLVQLVIFAWAASNLLRFPLMRRAALTAFVFGVVTLAMVQAFVPANDVMLDAGRVSALAENPNTAGAFFALGIVAALAVRREYSHNRPGLRLVMLAAAGVIIVQLVRTGSRSSMLGLMAGLLVYAFVSERFAAKVKTAVVSALIVGVALYVALNAEGFVERWTASLERKDLSRREEIFPVSLQMIRERPFVGWGPHEHLVELGRRFGVELLEEHNILLFVFAEGGMVTGVPFVVGLFLTALAALHARRTHSAVGPLALLLTLMVVNMANVYHLRKVHWLIVAFAVASAPDRRRLAPTAVSPVRSERLRRDVVATSHRGVTSAHLNGGG